MELIKFFFKDEVPAIGLRKFKDKREYVPVYEIPNINFNKQIFKPNYKNNFFLL
jgi:hypothetical protein